MTDSDNAPKDRLTILSGIERQMHDVTNNMTGLLYMFAKLNEQYYKLRTEEDRPSIPINFSIGTQTHIDRLREMVGGTITAVDINADNTLRIQCTFPVVE